VSVVIVNFTSPTCSFSDAHQWRIHELRAVLFLFSLSFSSSAFTIPISFPRLFCPITPYFCPPFLPFSSPLVPPIPSRLASVNAFTVLQPSVEHGQKCVSVYFEVKMTHRTTISFSLLWYEKCTRVPKRMDLFFRQHSLLSWGQLLPPPGYATVAHRTFAASSSALALFLFSALRLDQDLQRRIMTGKWWGSLITRKDSRGESSAARPMDSYIIRTVHGRRVRASPVDTLYCSVRRRFCIMETSPEIVLVLVLWSM